MTRTEAQKIRNIEYLRAVANGEIAFREIHVCSDCDVEFENAIDANNTGHLIVYREGEWGIAIACEGYHEFRE